MVEALHGPRVHAEHVHLRLREAGLWCCNGHAFFGERRHSGDALFIREALPDLCGQLRVEVTFARIGRLRDPGAGAKRDRAPRLRLLRLDDHIHPPDVLQRLNAQRVGQGIAGGESRREEHRRQRKAHDDKGTLRLAARDVPQSHPEGDPVARSQRGEDKGSRSEDAEEDQRQLVRGYSEEFIHRGPPYRSARRSRSIRRAS
jgi:hypothetical protein